MTSTKNHPAPRSARPVRFEIIPLPTGGAVVGRMAKRPTSKLGEFTEVFVPMMKCDSLLAATLWVEGQGELVERGEWAGYADPKQDPAVMDQAEDTFNLG